LSAVPLLSFSPSAGGCFLIPWFALSTFLSLPRFYSGFSYCSTGMAQVPTSLSRVCIPLTVSGSYYLYCTSPGTLCLCGPCSECPSFKFSNVVFFLMFNKSFFILRYISQFTSGPFFTNFYSIAYSPFIFTCPGTRHRSTVHIICLCWAVCFRPSPFFVLQWPYPQASLSLFSTCLPPSPTASRFCTARGEYYRILRGPQESLEQAIRRL